MRQNTHRFCAIGMIIVVALQPFVAQAFQATSETEPVSYSFISMDIPDPNNRLGFTFLADINNKGEIIGAPTRTNIGRGFLIDRTFSSIDIQDFLVCRFFV